MQVIRTILWVLVTAALVAFIAMNWTRVPVNLWPVDGGNYVHFEWPVGVIALVFFALGSVPMWLIHRAGQWRLKRRISSLESTVLSTTAQVQPTYAEPAPVVATPVITAPVAPASDLDSRPSLDKPTF